MSKEIASNSGGENLGIEQSLQFAPVQSACEQPYEQSGNGAPEPEKARRMPAQCCTQAPAKKKTRTAHSTTSVLSVRLPSAAEYIRGR